MKYFYFLLFDLLSTSYFSFAGNSGNEKIIFPHFFSQSADDKFSYDLRFSKGVMKFQNNNVSFQIISTDKNCQEIEVTKNKFKTSNATVECLQISFENSNIGCQLAGIEPLASTSNYLIGSNQKAWKQDLQNYSALQYKNLYNQIDLKYYVVESEVKYDYTILPGGNINDIKMRYSGIVDLQVNQSGTLCITTQLTEIKDYLPKSYQVIDGKEIPVKVEYRMLDEFTVGFSAHDYNKKYPLVIDPVLIYSTFIGGSSDEYQWVGGIDRDASGNIYHTGRTFSANFPTTAGTYQAGFGGSIDTYIYKLDPTGSTLIYSTFIGGSGDDAGYSVKVEQSTGNLWVVGSTDSPTFPVTPGAFQTTLGGTGLTDGFVLKLSNTGNNILYSSLFGQAYSDYGHGIDIDIFGDVYITGECNGPVYTTAGAYQTSYGGGTWDGWIVKLDPTLTTVYYSTMFGGNREDVPIAIKVDQNNLVYIAGFQNGGGMPTVPGSFDVTFNGGNWDAFVAKFNTTLSAPLYSTYLGTNGTDMIWNALQVNSNGEAIVAGFASSGFPTTAGAFQTAYAGGSQDVFVTKINSSGTALIYSTYVGGTGDDEAYGVFVQTNGEVYVTGFCQDNFPLTLCTYDSTYNGAKDAFIIKLSPNCDQLLFSTYIGGTSNDLGYNITVLNDTVFVAGETRSSNFPVSPGAYDNSYNGARDLFVLALVPSVLIVSANFNSAISVCTHGLIQFNNSSLNASFFLWDFGDGSSSTLQDPTHAFSVAGIYYIQLIASSICALPDTFSIAITVNDPPSALFSDSSNCGLLVNFYDNSNGATSYNWDFGDAGTDFGHAPVHTYNASGTYTVSLIVTNAFGCSDTIQKQIMITAAPLASFSFAASQCSLDIAFQNNSLNATSFLWNFDDGNTSTVLNPVHSYNSSGNYNIMMIANPHQCPDTTIQPISVNVPSIANFNIYPACDLSYNFLDNSVGSVVTYAWDFGDGIFSNSNNPSHTYLAAGNYLAKLFITDQNNCVDSISQYIIVFEDPIASFFFNPPFCTSEVTFQNSSSYGRSYHWDFGDGTTSDITWPRHNYASPGTYSVRLIADPTGCPDSITQQVTIQPLPIVDFISKLDCSLQAEFQNISDSAANYIWDFGDGFTDFSESALHTFALPDEYNIKLTGTNSSGCSDSINRTINLVVFASAAFETVYDTCSGTVLFSSLSESTSSVLWNFGDGVTSSSTIIDHSYTSANNYQVIFITNNETACADTLERSLEITFEPEPGLHIPNCFTPNGDGLNELFEVIDFNFCDSYHLMIYNRWGEMIFETFDLNHSWDGTFNGGVVPEGVYAWILKGDMDYKHGAVTVLK